MIKQQTFYNPGNLTLSKKNKKLFTVTNKHDNQKPTLVSFKINNDYSLSDCSYLEFEDIWPAYIELNSTEDKLIVCDYPDSKITLFNVSNEIKLLDYINLEYKQNNPNHSFRQEKSHPHQVKLLNLNNND